MEDETDGLTLARRAITQWRAWFDGLTTEQKELRRAYLHRWNAGGYDNQLQTQEIGYLAAGYSVVYRSTHSSNQNDMGGSGQRELVVYQTLEIPLDRAVTRIVQHHLDHPEHGWNCACSDNVITAACNWLESQAPTETGRNHAADALHRINAAMRVRVGI